MRTELVVFLAIIAFSAGYPQSSGKKSLSEIRTEETQARDLLDKQNFIAALPLYEDLHAQEPQDVRYLEGLAFALVAKAGQQSPIDAKVTLERARQLALQAKANGDNSNLLQTMLERLNAPAAPVEPLPLGYEWLQKGEAAFSKGSLQEAVDAYEKALEVNPNYYSAALFAGDAEFKMQHPAEAGRWFVKAIAINPDIETAHRYWADTLDKAGEHQRAEEQHIQAIVAEPYSRSPRVGLKQWADANHRIIVPPPVKLPESNVSEGKNGHINLTLPAVDSNKSDPEAAAQMSYSLSAAVWHGDKFHKEYPEEKTYRHSLAEEAASIRLMLTVLRENKIPEAKWSTSTKLLAELDRKGMLECWILLDNPDQGIAQDYVKYRQKHRDLLAAYIAQYDVHEK